MNCINYVVCSSTDMDSYHLIPYTQARKCVDMNLLICDLTANLFYSDEF